MTWSSSLFAGVVAFGLVVFVPTASLAAGQRNSEGFGAVNDRVTRRAELRSTAAGEMTVEHPATTRAQSEVSQSPVARATITDPQSRTLLAPSASIAFRVAIGGWRPSTRAVVATAEFLEPRLVRPTVWTAANRRALAGAARVSIVRTPVTAKPAIAPLNRFISRRQPAPLKPAAAPVLSIGARPAGGSR